MDIGNELKILLSHATLLMIDDSYYARHIAKKSIQELNLKTIYESANGSEALELYRSHKPDIILIDIVMDDMNGLQTLKNLKEENTIARVIMVSAVDVPKILSDCIDMGIDDFIVKPYSPSDIKGAIINALKSEKTK